MKWDISQHKKHSNYDKFICRVKETLLRQQLLHLLSKLECVVLWRAMAQVKVYIPKCIEKKLQTYFKKSLQCLCKGSLILLQLCARRTKSFLKTCRVISEKTGDKSEKQQGKQFFLALLFFPLNFQMPPQQNVFDRLGMKDCFHIFDAHYKLVEESRSAFGSLLLKAYS